MEVVNPFVDYLNRYTTASPEHEAAFDEFTTQTLPPPGGPLRLKTRIETFLQELFSRERPPSVILTGNAGDGKTYLCRKIVERFTGEPVRDWADRLDLHIKRDNFTLRVVKDLSETSEEKGAEILLELAVDLLEESPQFVFLIAANEGRLRAILQKEKLEDLYNKVDRQLREGPDLKNERLIVINLNEVTTSTYVPQALAWLSNPDHWKACEGCPALDKCPIRFNAEKLGDAHIQKRLQRLYRVLEHLDLHVTIRDMLVHLTYTLTGGLRCKQVQEESRKHAGLGWEAYRYTYYENLWGQMADESFRHRALVLRYLDGLNVGKVSIFEIDDFILQGAPDDKEAHREYERLFSPDQLDLGNGLFEQDRIAYLHGGGQSPGNENASRHPLIEKWLPHCRRKLFMEWSDEKQADRLVPFLFLPEYFRLTEGDDAWLNDYISDIILGLNRAFSDLYLTDHGYLYVTSQYARTVEQPVPIVRIRMPIDNIEILLQDLSSEALDRDKTILQLEFFPPPGVQAEPVYWSMDLLRFEYLMRRAWGGTPNILAAECDLAVRQLKDELLSRFAAKSADGKRRGALQIDFFAPDRTRYTFRSLVINKGIRLAQ